MEAARAPKEITLSCSQANPRTTFLPSSRADAVLDAPPSSDCLKHQPCSLGPWLPRSLGGSLEWVGLHLEPLPYPLSLQLSARPGRIPECSRNIDLHRGSVTYGQENHSDDVSVAFG